MKKKLKIIAAIVVGVLVMLLILPFLFNVNTFRPRIESELGSALGRKVAIGNLSLSVLSGSLRADNITIADDPAFSQAPFVKASSLQVGVEVLPLITSKTLHVTSLTLDKPEVTLLSGANGKWNFSSLGAEDTKPDDKAKPAAASAPAPKAPAEKSAGSGLSVNKLRINDGRITIGFAGGRHRSWEDVNLQASNLSSTTAFPFAMDARAPGGGKVHLEGKAGPIDSTDTSLTPVAATLKVAGLDLANSGFVAPDSGVAGLIDYDGKLASSGGMMDSSGVVRTQKLKLTKLGAPAGKPILVDYATDYDLRRQTGTLKRGAIKTGASAAQLTGTYDNRGAEMVLHMLLSAPGLPVNDVEALLPALGVTLPSGSSLQGGTATARLSIDGPLDKLVIAGPVSIANSRLVGFNLGSKMAAVSLLTGTSPGNDTTIQSMSTNLRVAPEGIRTDNLNAVISGLGSVAGNGVIGADNSLNYKMVAKLASGGGLMGHVVPGMRQSASSNGIGFAVHGTTSNPQISPDMASVAGSIAGGLLSAPTKAPAQDVGNVLGGFLGQKKKSK